MESVTPNQRSLDSLTQARQPIPISRVVEIVQGVAAVLDAQSAQGRVHGGLTPNHILIDEEGNPQFVVYDPRRTLADPLCRRAYHAPEQWREQTVDQRADQYALAVIAYELLTGSRRLDTPPLGGIQILDAVDVGPDVPIQPGAGLHVNAALRRALSTRASNRFRTTGEFAHALSTPPPARPVWRQLLWRMMPSLAIAALAAVVVVELRRTDFRAAGQWLLNLVPPEVRRAVADFKLP
jgi:serine/threonine protein kinase